MIPLRILLIDPVQPQDETIIMAADILARGGMIVAPSETRYGLLARYDDSDAVQRLFELKRRTPNQATAIFIHSRDEIGKLGIETEVSRRLAESFLPGPLTLVLKARPGLPEPIAVQGKIGLRISSSPVIARILDKGLPCLTATSANVSGQKEPATASEISELFGSAVDLYLEAGELSGPASTVVDCSGDDMTILRQGAIDETEIRRCAGEYHG